MHGWTQEGRVCRGMRRFSSCLAAAALCIGACGANMSTFGTAAARSGLGLPYHPNPCISPLSSDEAPPREGAGAGPR